MMVSRYTFNEIIKDVLGNLYDVVSLETHPAVFSVIRLPEGFEGNRGEYVRQVMLEAIEQLQPVRKDLLLTAIEWRPYLILKKRYVEGIGIQELSDMLAISQRQMRRDHHKALQALTEILWAGSNLQVIAEGEPEQNPVFDVHNEMIDPLETTRGVYALLKFQFDKKGIQVEFSGQEEFTPVITDRVILRQVLISLFNDILHNQVDQKLVISCAVEDNQVQIVFASQMATGWDSTSEEIEEGIENDLSAVRYWCERIDAHIEETLIQDGKTQWVNRVLWLPHSDQKIMLVIDDQGAVVNLFRRYLSQTDILTVGVSHPEQAIAIARHLQPTLITLDVMMPQIDGWELLQHIKLDEMLKNIPVIVCSAWDDPDLSHSLGAAGYLKKPVTQKMLLKAIEEVL